MRGRVVLHFVLSSRIALPYSSLRLLVVHDASARGCFLSVAKEQGWNVFSRFIPLSRACARTRTSESLCFLLSQPSQKFLQSTVIEWVIALFSQFLRAESFFVWRTSLIHLLKYVWNICVFICLSGGVQRNLWRLWKQKVENRCTYAHTRARGRCLYWIFNDMERMFWEERKTPPPEVEELDRNRVDGSEAIIYLPSIAKRIWRAKSA